MARIKFNLNRANASGALDVAEQFWDYHKSGMDISESALQLAIEAAVDKYQVHIAAAFARVGIVVTPGEKITASTLLDVINSKTGLQIEALTPTAVRQAYDTQMSARLTELLGVPVESLDNIEAIKQALIDKVKEAAMSEKSVEAIRGVITKALIKKIKNLKTFKDAGLQTKEEQKKVMNRYYQKQYRRGHKEVWDDAGGGGSDWNQDMYNHPRDT